LNPVYRSAFAAAVLVLAAATVPVHAQSRVFVGAQGSDANPCSFALPCRTFQHAHDVVAANGEINALDPAGYGPVTITKGISIQGHGFAAISVASGSAITVNAGAADAVHLNGLLIDGGGLGVGGINLTSGAALRVENSVVRHVTQVGLQFLSSSATMTTLAVSNSYFTDMGGDGILVYSAGSGLVSAAIDRTALYGTAPGGVFSGAGVHAIAFGSGPVAVAVTDSVSAFFYAGFMAESLSGAATNLSLTHGLATGNSRGVQASGNNAALWLSDSTLSGNVDYLSAAVGGGTVNSYGDNRMLDSNGVHIGPIATFTRQ
jgi:hypothetical protein